MKDMKDLMKKLRSTDGDSIAEVLVAVLITALATLVFATMVSTSVQMIENSSEKMNEYYDKISADANSKENVTLNFTQNVNGKNSITTKLYENQEIYFYLGGEANEQQ